MELKIRRDSNFTIHIQLKEQIKGLILNNILENGTQLPTVRQLGEFLRINKNTVSKVYKELEEEGYVYSVKGRGTFVSSSEKPKRTKEFMDAVDAMLKKGMEYGLQLDEIWGIVYSKSQHFKFLEVKKNNRTIGFVECNQGSINDFKNMARKTLHNVDVEGIMIDDLVHHFEDEKDRLDSCGIVVVPYIHFPEVKKELAKLGKEVITIGTNQSLKILTYSKKLKNKKVGIIGYSEEDETAISRQFKKINVKEFVYYGGYQEENDKKLKDFLRNIDFLIVYSPIIEFIENKMKPKKPFVIFEGKYDRNDMKILTDIFGS